MNEILRDRIADMHTHLLPAMDDGAQSLGETVALLALEREQGIQAVVATPHYNAMRESPDEFLQRRAVAAEAVKSILTPEDPRLYLGAEVSFFRGMSKTKEIRKLCVLGTPFLLVEMPFWKWGKAEVEELSALIDRQACIPILAHTERYLGCVSRRTWERLAGEGILLQSNAEFLADAPRKAAHKIRRGLWHLIGSDCHNAKRPPNITSRLLASPKIADELFWETLGDCSEDVLATAIPLV